ncbi:tat pathway signal sequence [Beauveria bassiana ARSEF 2860]|uniref:Tat pathway signal sequence n=1 Tax=Beauveria bassiana (strain ARSEF 2860) TaxID=655819 RepID=J4UW25_BEAB2|nr:tat pathway signal sequence [Beauveria bassiana ARSEF 2860]EJP70447.1 tat pathway signal sequence [Beauveria bassiana ARSEF 2860]
MSDSKHDGYSEIINEEEHDAFLDNSFRGRAKTKGLAIESWILYASLSFILLFVGGVIGYNLRPSTAGSGLAFADTSQLNIYNGVDFPPFEQRFNGSLFKRSPYSGPPTPEMDKTWGRYTEMGSNDARASTSYSLETAVHLEETQNIGYMASLGLFHQIHCLNMLRKFIYLDYYKEKTPDWFSQPYLRAHADHCVDMIREAIMCHGDTSLIVYHWIDGYKDPVPDFSTMHTCRNPEAILSWMQKNQIILSKAVYKHGEKDLPEIF